MEIIPRDRLTAEDVRELTERLLREQLSVQVEGYKITTSMGLNVLLKAAVEKRSIEAVCADLTDVVDRNTWREAVNRVLTIEDLHQHEAQFDAVLAECIPVAMPRCGLEMAIDFHDEPFYGKSEALQAYSCRGEAQDGTTCFWRIASLYVRWREVRITLALTDVLPKESALSSLQRLLKRGAALGFHARVLSLDKGFCTGERIGDLQGAHQPTVIACPIRGKKRKVARAPCVMDESTTEPTIPLPMGQGPSWLSYLRSNGTRRRGNGSGRGGCMCSFTWIGRPRKRSRAIVGALGLSPHIANWGRCVRRPTRATWLCDSAILPSGCYCSMSGPFSAASAPGSSVMGHFDWI